MITCRSGYVSHEGDKIGVVVLRKSRRALGKILGPLVSAGFEIRQKGDTEAAGVAAIADIDAILRILGVWRIPKAKGRPFTSAYKGVSAPTGDERRL